MKKKIVIGIILIICLMLSSFVCATRTIDDLLGGVPSATFPEGQETANKIIGAIKWAGYIIATCMIMYIGIKYILASADEKANLKGAIPKYLFGAGLIILCTQLGTWIFKLF